MAGFKYNFFLRYIQETYIVVTLSAILGFDYRPGMNVFELLCVAVSVMLFFLFNFAPFKIGYEIFVHKAKNLEVEKYGSAFSSLDLERAESRVFYFIFFIRRFILILSVTALQPYSMI